MILVLRTQYFENIRLNLRRMFRIIAFLLAELFHGNFLSRFLFFSEPDECAPASAKKISHQKALLS